MHWANLGSCSLIKAKLISAMQPPQHCRPIAWLHRQAHHLAASAGPSPGCIGRPIAWLHRQAHCCKTPIPHSTPCAPVPPVVRQSFPVCHRCVDRDHVHAGECCPAPSALTPQFSFLCLFPVALCPVFPPSYWLLDCLSTPNSPQQTAPADAFCPYTNMLDIILTGSLPSTERWHILVVGPDYEISEFERKN